MNAHKQALLPVSALLLALCPLSLFAGWNFDTGFTPEELSVLLATDTLPAAPANSWLRLHDMERAFVRAADGREVAPWAGCKPSATIAERRQALTRLHGKGYRFVAFLRWPSESWVAGVRPDSLIRRLPLDLREAYERCRSLAATYGDLIDYWEIDNEPDISFVEENPETYAAFLKACHFGIQCSKGNVIMAPLALPPGPYFEAFAKNAGLHYTAGLNYHYYGYAEDFTGVYQQFQNAAREFAPNESADATFITQFYPNVIGWSTTTVATFDHAPESALASREFLETRPLDAEEPALVAQGRWLVSPGVTVEESAGVWRFHVTSWAPGPLRPAMVELPLPAGWKIGRNALLTFQYRLAPASGHIITSQATTPLTSRPVPSYPSAADSPSIPAFPVFITEYGYGLLSKEARKTDAGRSRQQAWFASVAAQIHDLGIPVATAFLLRPYLEAGNHEFGLLMTPENAPATGARWGSYIVSPALATLLKAGRTPGPPVTPEATTPSHGRVVLDFAPGSGLAQAKEYCGYFLRNARSLPAEGNLLVYNFDSATVAGELSLDGSCWTLGDGGQSAMLSLAPGERRQIPVRIVSSAAHFEPQAARALFRIVSVKPGHCLAIPSPMSAPAIIPHEIQATAHSLYNAPFEPYFRTKNGNLYQTWPRLSATGTWQRFSERAGNFTMAFFGRAHLPWRFEDNEPAALVFFFRPGALPETFEIRNARVMEFAAP